MYTVISGEWEWNIPAKSHKEAALDAIDSIDFHEQVELGQTLSVLRQGENEDQQKWFLTKSLLQNMRIKPTQLRIV